MTPVSFIEYGVRGTKVTLIAERVTHWHQIDYNGNYGTAVYLDTGVKIGLRAWPEEVEKALRAAIDAMRGKDE